MWLLRLRGFWPDSLSVDRALAVVLTVGAELEIWLGSDAAQHRLAAGLAAPAIMAPIAVRRRYPMLVGTVVPVLSAFVHAFWDPRFAAGLALVVAVYFSVSAGSVSSLRGAMPFIIVTVVVMLLVRRVVGDRERRAQIAERERDVAAREAVVEERARIARELHDVIAHHVSMIVVQAGAERSVLGDENASTREVLETVEQSGRSALTEMRRLLGMLRGDASEPLAPQPGLADVPTLVGQLREAGLPVELRINGERRELPVGIELSAYRIVQEALTNALKHAGDAHASVNVHYGPDSLELEIADDGAGANIRATGGGHGLVGMRERVALYGGRFQASRNPSGGFVIRVALPIR